MFAYKSFLKIGEKDSMPLPGELEVDSVELASCTYTFNKEIDEKGQPQSGVVGGIITLEITCLPSNPILEWAMTNRKYESGAIVVTNGEGMALERLYFTDAACVSIEISYVQTGKAYIKTKLVLSAKKLSLGENTIDNRWVNI